MEDIRGIQHPLQTPLVLECIFKDLGYSDLMACRQVCRAWHKEATSVVRPLTQVYIGGDSEGRKLAYFLELVQSEASTFTESPFVNTFIITDINYREEGAAFLEFCGRIIKSLHLSRVCFESDDEFGHAIFQSCPNLEELSLEHVKVNPKGNVGDQPVIWLPPRFPQNRNLKSLTLDDNRINGLARMETLSHFPCLEKLKLEGREKDDWVFRSLTILREHDNEGWLLKSLGLDLCHLDEPLAILPTLVEGNLALEEFDASGIEEPEHVIVLRRILEAHANSLKKLYLRSFLDLDDAFVGLNNVTLKKLEFLDLEEVDLSSTNFLRNLPNLRCLKIWRSRAVQSEDPIGDWVLHNCTELTLNDEELEAGDFHNLLRRLPNLEKLVMRRCNNEMFAMICGLCPNLIDLNLSECNNVDDCGISGLDVDDVARVNQEGANGRTWRPVTVARPNLSSLKNLKWFRFSPLLMTRNYPLGFCAALCGVQQLPQLQHLRLDDFLLGVVPIWERLLDQYPWVDQ